MKLRIEHRTRYAYTEPLRHAVQRLCLTPASNAHQSVLAWSVQASGRLHEGRDAYGNVVHHCTLDDGRRTSDVHAAGIVRTHASPWLQDGPGRPSAWLYLRDTPLTLHDQALASFARDVASRGDFEERVIALAHAVADHVDYQAGHTEVDTSARHAFAVRRGVCQDQSHVLIAACRSLGLPARYVSGYFHAPGAEALASHAWVDVCPDPGTDRWLSVDVTHRCLIDERHVRLAVGPDYAACAPVRGVREGGGEERMEVDLRVVEELD